MKKLFILDKENDYASELKEAHKKTLGTKFLLIAIHSLMNYSKKKKIDVVITNGLAEEHYYLIKGLRIPSITFGPKELYSEFSDIIIDYKAIDDKRYFTGEQSKVSGNDDF